MRRRFDERDISQIFNWQENKSHFSPCISCCSGSRLAFACIMGYFASFRGTKGSYSSTFFPTRYTLDNYIKLFTDFSVFNFPKMVWNTFIIASVSCIISTFFVISVAYTLSRLRFRARKPLMNAAMIIHLFPGFMSIDSRYITLLKCLAGVDGPMLRVAMIAVYAGGDEGCGYQYS